MSTIPLLMQHSVIRVIDLSCMKTCHKIVCNKPNKRRSRLSDRDENNPGANAGVHAIICVIAHYCSMRCAVDGIVPGSSMMIYYVLWLRHWPPFVRADCKYARTRPPSIMGSSRRLSRRHSQTKNEWSWKRHSRTKVKAVAPNCIRKLFL